MFIVQQQLYEKKREEEFAPPDYDHHMYDLPDEHTIESQECDSIPVRSIPDCGSHSCHPEVYGPSRCEYKEECKEEDLMKWLQMKTGIMWESKTTL